MRIDTTHFFNIKEKEHNPVLWSQFFKIFKRLVELKHEGIELFPGIDEDQKGDCFANPDIININGDQSKGIFRSNLFLSRNCRSYKFDQTQKDEDKVCTEGFPYDFYVKVALILYKYLFQSKVEIASTDSWREWVPACNFVEHHVGILVREMMFTELEANKKIVKISFLMTEEEYQNYLKFHPENNNNNPDHFSEF